MPCRTPAASTRPSSATARKPPKGHPAMPHPHPYASRERDYDPAVGRDIGPWDADAVGDDGLARAAMDDAALDQRLVTVSASIPVDAGYEADALHNDGRVVGVVVRRPRGMYSMIVITAVPRSQRLWADHLVTVDQIGRAHV